MAKRCDNCKPDLCLFSGGSGGGGGGGGGGVGVYTVTLINSSNVEDEHYTFESAQTYSVGGVMRYNRSTAVDVFFGQPVTLKLLALDDTVFIFAGCFENIDDATLPVVTGDIVFSIEDGGFIVSGNGTITLASSNK